jgi:hypothetical protein
MGCGKTGRNGNITYKKESSWGTYIAGDTQLRASTESLNRTVEHTEDPALVGEIYTTDMIKVGDGIAGSIESVMHGDVIGEMTWSVLGGQDAPVNPVKSWVLVSYNGTANYARLTKSGTNLTAETRNTSTESWTGDTNFSTAAGILDLSAAANDTLTELTAVITGKTGYDAILFGVGTNASSDITDFAATEIRNNDVRVGGNLMQLQNTSTVAKTHAVYPASSTECLPSFSYTINRVIGANKSIGAVGCKHSSITYANTAKDLSKYTLAVDGKAEEIDQTDITLSIPTVEGFLAANMKIVVEEPDGSLVEMDEVKDYSLTVNANLDDNRVIGSFYKKEQTRQGSTIESSFTANNTDTQYAIRTNYTADSPVGFYIYWKSNDNCDGANSIPYSMMVRIPDLKLTDYNSPLSTPDRLTITGAGTVIKPQNTVYTKHIYAYITDGDTSSY